MATPIIGIHGRVVAARLWLRAAWLALRAYRNVRRAASALTRMRRRATSTHFTTGKFARSRGRYYWNLYSPGFPSRAFDRLVERELDRIDPFRDTPRPLHSAIVAITKRCILACEHCSEWDGRDQPETLSLNDMLAIVNALRNRGVTQVMFSGGEPLRRFEDLLAIVKAASADADVWVLTSGHGMSEERAERLRAAGLTGIVLALDHWDRQRHDRFRGVDGVFASAERAAEYAQSAALLVALSLCATREFVTDQNLTCYADTARDLGASFIQILEPKPVGRYAGRDVDITTAQQQLLEQFAERLNMDPAYQRFPAVAYPDFTTRTEGCFGAGERYVYIDADGALHACPFCRTAGGPAREFQDALAVLRSAGCPEKDRCAARPAAVTEGVKLSAVGSQLSGR